MTDTTIAQTEPVLFAIDIAKSAERGASQGRPIDLFVTAGQVSDYIGARALLSDATDV